MQNMAGSLDQALVENHVQELANTNGDGPTKSPLSPSIPIVDFHLLSSSSTKEREEEMEKLKLALTSWGCFQGIGHDIPSSLLERVHNMAKEFFHLPLDEKRRCSMTYDGTEGYKEGYGNRVVVAQDQVREHQHLAVKVKPDDQRKLNLFPENPNDFREILHEYSTKVSLVNEFLLKTLAKMVGLEEDYFLNQAGERAQCFARFNYYPPCPGSDDLAFGIGPHSDAGAITYLLQDKQVEGLQALLDGQWINVPVIPHALLVNVADQLEIMSNGVFKSLVHRVLLDSERERISVAVFYWPEMEKDVEPAAKLIDENRPKLYKKVHMKDYAMKYVPRNMQGKRAIEWVKV